MPRAPRKNWMQAAPGDGLTRVLRSGPELLSQILARQVIEQKVCVGVVSHRNLQVDQPETVADRIRRALEHIAPVQLIVSSDCGFGRQGCNRPIASFKAAAIAQGTNIVRDELGLQATYVPAADPAPQTDIVPKTARCPSRGRDRGAPPRS